VDIYLGKAWQRGKLSSYCLFVQLDLCIHTHTYIYIDIPVDFHTHAGEGSGDIAGAGGVVPAELEEKVGCEMAHSSVVYMCVFMGECECEYVYGLIDKGGRKKGEGGRGGIVVMLLLLPGKRGRARTCMETHRERAGHRVDSEPVPCLALVAAASSSGSSSGSSIAPPPPHQHHHHLPLV
jgi:hypothetical protein